MKYKATFNYHGEVITLWTHAKSEQHAFSCCIHRLVKMLGVIRVRLYNYFKDQNRYLIEEKEAER